jgi:hypothetical protein
MRAESMLICAHARCAAALVAIAANAVTVNSKLNIQFLIFRRMKQKNGDY